MMLCSVNGHGQGGFCLLFEFSRVAVALTLMVKPGFFMLAEAACCLVCLVMLIEKMRLPDFESVVH